MKKHSFILGAILLAIGGFVAKAIGAFYKIPLANILGSNGMGVYYLIFPLYSLLLVLISSGVSIAVTKMVSQQRANNNRHNELLIFKVSLVLVFVLGLLFSFIIIVFSDGISHLQGNQNASLGYFAIAPAIVFASLISVIRAYFQGLQNMIPTAMSNVFEQIVKVVFGLILSNALMSKGIEYAVLGALLAVTISEFVAFILILINFLYHKKKLSGLVFDTKPTNEDLDYKQTLKILFKYSLPATLSSLIIPITAFLDSFMVINLIKGSGQTNGVATSLYGLHSGVVNTIVSIPAILSLAISTAIVPNLSGMHTKNHEKELSVKSSFFIKITWLLVLPCFVFILIMSPDIIRVLFARGLSDKIISEFGFAYQLLRMSSVSILLIAFLQTFNSILQSINKPSVPFISLSIGLVVRTILVTFLVKIPKINIFGLVISNTVFLAIAIIINLIYLRKYIYLKFDFLKTFVSPIFASVVMGITCYLTKSLLVSNIRPLYYTVVCGVVCLSFYLVVLYTLRVFSKKELEMFPALNKITRKKRKTV